MENKADSDIAFTIDQSLLQLFLQEEVYEVGDEQVRINLWNRIDKQLPRKDCEQKTMRNKLYPSEYLALLTLKYDVDSDMFFNALISAWKNGKAECGNLLVECRSKQSHKVTLLITQDSKVIAQFKIPEEFFSKPKNPLKGVKAAYMTEKYTSKKLKIAQSFQIKDLRVGMKKVKLEARVVEVSKPRYVVTRFGNCASVANAMVSDDTGKIKLCLWNDQISSIAVGDTVQIENASISAFKNERQLRVGKNGVLRIA